jgi:hypothetical protein
MNFVEGGMCHITGEKCLLGPRGVTAKNSGGECEMHGRFDVWLTEENNLFISDMGTPAEEPKRCFALGVNVRLALDIATAKAKQFGTHVLTSQRTCIKCGAGYWMTDYGDSAGLLETAHSHLCPNCRATQVDADVERLGTQRYWCG